MDEESVHQHVISSPKFDSMEDEFDTLDLLGKKHILKIIKVLCMSDKPLRYKEISAKLRINTKTLTDRLQELEKFEIVKRVSYNEIPPRVEYSITPIVEDLGPILHAIAAFEDKHLKKFKAIASADTR